MEENTNTVDRHQQKSCAKASLQEQFLATEFNHSVADGLFAATSPLEGLRMLVSDAATVGPEDEGHCQRLVINDVSRAFFAVPMARKVCIGLPQEVAAGHDEVGLLLMSLFGT